jgi:hypothetical protein
LGLVRRGFARLLLAIRYPGNGIEPHFVALPSAEEFEVEMSEAGKLRRDHDGTPCEHYYLVRETCRGSKTGDYVCTSCGESFSPAEMERMKAEELN